jgi:hypothetical protein
MLSGPWGGPTRQCPKFALVGALGLDVDLPNLPEFGLDFRDAVHGA